MKVPEWSNSPTSSSGFFYKSKSQEKFQITPPPKFKNKAIGHTHYKDMLH